jgi:paraquat-inducible protein B
VSILIGGIAFETPATGPVLPPAEEGASFTLFKDRAEAFKPAARNPQTYVVVFEQPVRGLAVGAPVDFRGIPIGQVVDVAGHLDVETFDFTVRVTLEVDAEAVGIETIGLKPGFDRDALRRKVVDSLVSRGVRAQLRTGSLLSGSLYVALDFFPNAPPATVDWSQHPAQLPTIPGKIEVLEADLSRILEKVAQIPFEKIGDDLRKVLVELDRTLASARGTFDSATTLIEPNSVLGQQLDSTLQEVSGAARAVRLLADYLERHPEALLRGKTGKPK